MRTVDESGMWSLDSRLHDFGFRGCTSVEQSIIGGVSHLVSLLLIFSNSIIHLTNMKYFRSILAELIL